MSKKMKRFVMMLLVVVMSVSILAVPAAADTKEYTASIPVEIQIDPHYVPVVKDTYKINVTPDKASYPMPEGGVDGVYDLTIPNNASKGTRNLEFTFSGLGEYTYEISQNDCDNNGDCYEDKSVYTLKIDVLNEVPSNPSAGGVVVKVVMKLKDVVTDEKPETALFVNKYAKPVEVPFSASKIYNNKTPKTKLFYFDLKDSNGKNIESVYNVGKDVMFTPIVFDKVGTYTYTITEEQDTRSGVIFDKSVYTITVVVDRDIDAEGDYTAEVTYQKNGYSCKENDLVFINKSITGGNPLTGDPFQMILWVSVMAFSLAGLVVLVSVRTKRGRK